MNYAGIIVMRVLILILTSLLATQVMADTPFYVGGGYGYAKLKQDVDIPGDTNFDDESGSYTLFVGFELNDRIAFEGGYIDFGDVDDKASAPNCLIILVTPVCGPDINTKTKFEADGWYANAQYHFPMGNSGSLDLMGGIVYGDSKTKTNNTDTGNKIGSDDSDDSGLMFGLGYTHQLTPTLYLRGAGTYYKLDFDNVIENPYRFSVDLIWDF
jgi:opacity protein-like surface antigen